MSNVAETVRAVVLEVDISRVKANPSNPRVIKDASFRKLVQFIKEFPQMLWKRPPVVVTDGDGYMILGGNQRTEAARVGGMKTIPIMIADDWSEEQRKEFIVRDNDQSGQWDFTMLTQQYPLDFITELTTIDIPKAYLAPTDGREDEMLKPPIDPVTQLGDLWVLGSHRLRCGDSCDKAHVEELLNGNRPLLMVTDPPYGVNYDPSWRNGVVDKESGRRKGVMGAGPRAVGKVKNDDRADWREAWALFPGDVAYVWHGGLASAVVAESLASAGFELRSQIIWNKVSLVPGRGNYHWKHEPCWYAVRKGGKAHYSGDRKQSTVWDISHRRSATGHGTQKPVECMKRPIENNSVPGGQVYDPFGGSGTTIIACEMTGRHCFAGELDPAYVDTTILRWQEFTGQKAILASAGLSFEEVKLQRKA